MPGGECGEPVFEGAFSDRGPRDFGAIDRDDGDFEEVAGLQHGVGVDIDQRDGDLCEFDFEKGRGADCVMDMRIQWSAKRKRWFDLQP